MRQCLAGCKYSANLVYKRVLLRLVIIIITFIRKVLTIWVVLSELLETTSVFRFQFFLQIVEHLHMHNEIF